MINFPQNPIIFCNFQLCRMYPLFRFLSLKDILGIIILSKELFVLLLLLEDIVVQFGGLELALLLLLLFLFMSWLNILETLNLRSRGDVWPFI